MDPISSKTALAAAGAGGEALYVDDVFSTYLYDGTGAAQTITNGIDLSGEGGLVWIKERSSADSHALFDTERGVQKYVKSDAADGQYTRTDALSAFNSDGFSFNGAFGAANQSSAEYASWTFRKAPGFFDVVTYTGTWDGVTTPHSQTISHNLGSTPGVIIIKQTNATRGWMVYHTSTGAGQNLKLDTTAAAASNTNFIDNTVPTSTTFKVGASHSTNSSGGTYVAYLFAHDDQSFGEDEDEAIIKCGTFTTDGSYNGSVTLGWEPQWVMVKNANATGGWFIHDTMRGAPVSGDSAWLYANLSNVEASSSVAIRPNATGFTSFNHSANTEMIYIAIRRPHKPPEAGTDVFSVDSQESSGIVFRPGFVTDFGIKLFTSGGNTTYSQMALARLTGDGFLATSQTNAESTAVSNAGNWDNMIGWGDLGGLGYGLSFKRAPGFFDVVTFAGTGSARTVNHNLGVKPELMIVKRRNLTESWAVYTEPTTATHRLRLNQTFNAAALSTYWNDTEPTSSVFTVGPDNATNASGSNYIAYLFATLPGISKVGSYTGTGSNIGVDCGFTAGARFVLIKRTDSSGDWYVYDSARGIVGGNDPYLLINSTAAETTTTDYIDPLNSGFTVTSSAPAALNASGGTYIFLAIA